MISGPAKFTDAETGEVRLQGDLAIDTTIPPSGFTIGSSYLCASFQMKDNADSTFPNFVWTQGAAFDFWQGLTGEGSDLAINGMDNTVIDVLTTGWYQATVFASCYRPGSMATVVAFQSRIGFLNGGGSPPYFGQLYAGLANTLDATQNNVTTGPVPVTAPGTFGGFCGAYLANPLDLWDVNGGAMIVRVA